MGALDDLMKLRFGRFENKVKKATTIQEEQPSYTSPSQTVQQGSQLEATQPAPQVVAPAPEAPKFKSYEDIFKAGNPNPQLTEEERKKELKREKSRAAIAGLGDAASAIANLVFASKGATTPQAPSLSAMNAQRYQQLRQQREAKSDQYQNALTSARMRDKDFGYQQYRDSVSNRMQERSFDMQQKHYNQQQQKEAERFEEEKRRAAVSERNDDKRLGLAAAAQAGEIQARQRQLDIDSAYKQSIADYRAQAAGIPKNSIPLYDSESDKNVYIDKAKFATMAPDILSKMLEDKDFISKYSEGRSGGASIVARQLKELKGVQVANFVRENWNKSKVARESIAALSTETIKKENLFEEEKPNLFD